MSLLSLSEALKQPRTSLRNSCTGKSKSLTGNPGKSICADDLRVRYALENGVGAYESRSDGLWVSRAVLVTLARGGELKLQSKFATFYLLLILTVKVCMHVDLCIKAYTHTGPETTGNHPDSDHQGRCWRTRPTDHPGGNRRTETSHPGTVGRAR